LPCMCANFRRASRAITQLYEEALRPLGLRASQFTLLQALSLTGEISQGQLGQILALDSTTLTRTLEIMIGHKWISERRGSDRRERWLQLSKAGEAQFKQASPAWNRVQSRLREQIGEEPWKNLLQFTNQVTTIAINQGGQQ